MLEAVPVQINALEADGYAGARQQDNLSTAGTANSAVAVYAVVSGACMT